MAAGPEPSVAEGKVPGKRRGPRVADAPANAAGGKKGAILDMSCSHVYIFCSAVPLDNLAVACLIE